MDVQRKIGDQNSTDPGTGCPPGKLPQADAMKENNIDVDFVVEIDVDDSEIVITPLVEFMTAGASPMRDDIMAAIKYALGDRYPGIELVPSMSAGATDGVFFRAVGIPVYGTSGIFAVPGAANAHGLNENTAVETFYDSLGYWERLMKRLTGGVGAQ